MKPEELLSQLSDLEAKLKSFSYEELSLDEASQIKDSFTTFKDRLESKVISPQEKIFSKKTFHRTTNNKPKEDMSLVAKVSHELRTPLNGILGFADLLKDSSLTNSQSEQVNAIKSASFNLLEIVNELMDFTMLSQGREKIEQIDFNFYSIVRNALYLCNTLILDKKVALEVDLDTDIPEQLIGDPSKLSQILLNLLGNAIKFVDQGAICLKVGIKEELEEGVLLEFQVIDTGIGIAKEDLATVFEPYSQGPKYATENVGGYGLGLSIVKQLIENLNGSLSVASKLGVGTTFKFSIPFYKNESQLPTKAFTDKKASPKELALIKGTSILVFEDNPLNMRLIENRLNAWGCKTMLAETAANGLALLETQKIDIVLMDLRMPEIDGFQATKCIREHKNLSIRELPIIAVTADFSIKDQRQCNSYGINDYILKPYSAKELLNKLLAAKKQPIMEALKPSALNTNKETSQVINMDTVLEECMGDFGLLEELVKLFKLNAIEFIGKAKMNLDLGEFEEIALGAHKIKASLAMMGTQNLYLLIKQIQTACAQEKDKKHIYFLYNCFVEEFPQVEIAITNEMIRLGSIS